MSGERLVRALLPVAVAGFVGFVPHAHAQEDPGGKKRPDRRGRRLPFRPGGEHPAPMQVSGGELYVVTGSTIRKLGAKTLEEAATAVIPVPVDAERETRAKEMFMERFDKDGDGFVREDEVRNPAIIRKLDRDGDGAVGIGEVPSRRAMTRGPPGPVTLLVHGADVYVYRDGWLYRYDAADLTLQAQNEIAPRRVPERPPGWPARKDKRGKRDRDAGGRKRKPKGEADPPPPPELPDEPLRF